MQIDPFEISTQTTGFGSPARAYTKRRLSPNDLVIDDPYSTFFFQWEGEEKYDLKWGEYLVVDRSGVPTPEDLVVFSGEEKLEVELFKNIDPNKLWGVITWKLCRIKK